MEVEVVELRDNWLWLVEANDSCTPFAAFKFHRSKSGLGKMYVTRNSISILTDGIGLARIHKIDDSINLLDER